MIRAYYKVVEQMNDGSSKVVHECRKKFEAVRVSRLWNQAGHQNQVVSPWKRRLQG